MLSHKNFVILAVFLALSGNLEAARNKSPTYQRFLEDSLVECHRTSKGKSPNLIEYYWRLSWCESHKWDMCMSVKKRDAFQDSYVCLTYPCYHGDQVIRESMTRVSYHIQTLPLFQLNLTFTKFVLKRSVSGCSYHDVWVGQGIKRTIYILYAPPAYLNTTLQYHNCT